MTTLSVDETPDSSIPDRATAPRFLGGGRIGVWDREVRRPGPGELLLGVRANAVCGSDRPAFENGWPVVPGHETAGVVVAVGEGSSIPIGTAGVVYFRDYCGVCRMCRAGATHQCLAKPAEMGFNTDGGYAPYELVHETNFFPVPADIPLAEATLLLDTMGTTGHAIDRASLLTQEVRAVAVSGAGPLGLGLVVMIRLLVDPAIPVAVSDVKPVRLQLVELLGGLPIDVRTRSLAEGLRAHGLSEVDLAIDTAGRADTRRELLDVVARRGVLVCLGAPQGLELVVLPDLIGPERAILGCEYFPFDDLQRNLALLRAHAEQFRPIITHRFPVAELTAALELFMSGATGKVVIEQ